jgi:uncharacterized membrane protein YhaH (DUF805 family)
MLKKMFSYEGRMGRRDFILIFLLAVFLSGLVSVAGRSVLDNDDLALFPAIIMQLAVLSGASVQRLHDLGRPGFHYFLLFMPFYSIYLMLVLIIKKGTEGSNRYGDDPVVPVIDKNIEE